MQTSCIILAEDTAKLSPFPNLPYKELLPNK